VFAHAGAWPARRRRATAVLSVILAASPGCQGLRDVKRADIPPEQLRSWSDEETASTRKESPFLKAHMRNGDLFVLSEWAADSARAYVSGVGTHFDPMRRVIAEGELRVPVDSVAVFETNVVTTSNATGVLTALAVITIAVAVYCVANPKSCFGSCPTFYLAGVDHPVAEGFSASIAPSLEATDVDELPARMHGGEPVEVVMKNEALETHVVRFVNLLALPHACDARVLRATDGTFYAVDSIAAPVRTVAAEGDCLAGVRAWDGVERFSRADSTQLATSESIWLAFAGAPSGPCGVVIACRQTLLSTYLLYQTFAYMGSMAGHWMAELERDHLGEAGGAVVDLLGGIVVRIEASPGVWVTVGEVREFGPIAVDRHLVRFDAPASWTGNVRLDMTQGAWRIDQVGLVRVGESVEPIRLSPVAVAHDGSGDNSALHALLDLERSLTTLPGDTYSLVYSLPDDDRTYDLFLESRGYYLEWIREAWLREESPSRLAEVFSDPGRALARMAPEFKKVEPGMEAVFWSSRYAK